MSSGFGRFFVGGQDDYFRPGTAPPANWIGEDYSYGASSNPIIARENERLGRRNIGSQIGQYGQGNMSLAQLLSDASTMDDNQRLSAFDEIAVNPLSGSKLATQQVQENDILKHLYGQGGALERAGSEEQDLAGRGYKLQPEDYEAYGQASGDIARMFGKGEQNLAQSLASRGLSQAPSGVAAQQFSGLHGNKMEQLAASQRAIADDRMKMNLQRLSNTRQWMNQLGGGANTAINDQFGRNISGTKMHEGQSQANLDALLNKQRNDLQGYGIQQGSELSSAKNKQDRESKGLFNSFEAGLNNSFYQEGARPGRVGNRASDKAVDSGGMMMGGG